MKTVEVFLSTYNGEKYIDEQIRTILQQEGVEIILSIRDDGSTDSTVEVLKKYSDFPNVNIEFGHNLGYQESFLNLLRNSSRRADYYCFSDQDDIWLKDKLIRGIEKIEVNSSISLSCLYFSSLKVVDSTLNFLYIKNFNDRRLTLGSLLSSTNLAGCTFIFNRFLLDKVLQCTDTQKVKLGHDAWICRIAASIGALLIYDSESYIEFRRHENTTSHLNKSILFRIKDAVNKIINNSNRNSDIARIILKTYSNDISDSSFVLLNKISNYRTNLKIRIELLFNNQLNTGNLVIDFLTKVKILAGVY